jgi:hypothetical protein
MNMSWFYAYLTEDMNETIDFDVDKDYDVRKNRAEMNEEPWDEEKQRKKAINWTIKLFEDMIDMRVNWWVDYKVFGHSHNGIDFEMWENIFDYLHDEAIEYIKSNPQVKLESNEEEE